MSERAWSRPALQRTELGPMMHDFAHQVYDATEARALEGLQYFGIPLSIFSLGDFVYQTETMMREALDEPAQKESIDNLIEHLDREHAHPGVDYSAHNITTVGSVGAILEGLSSGIVTPGHLYMLINSCESDDGSGNLSYDGLPKHPSKHYIKAEEFADRLVSADFLRMLHELAYAPNGYLGSSSIASYGIAEGLALSCFKGIGYQPDWPQHLKRNDQGRVTGFSDNFLQGKRQEIRNVNTTDKVGRHTGGCPVRHATFKSVGATATDYLEGERPRNEGVSAITRAAQLLSNVMKAKLAE